MAWETISVRQLSNALPEANTGVAFRPTPKKFPSVIPAKAGIHLAVHSQHGFPFSRE
jgi:hypothetical protein